MIDLRLGDCVEWAKNYPSDAPRFHALLCDPPYHLYNDPRGIARYTGGLQDWKKGTVKGFMGARWDGGDIAFNPETWAAFANVLHDGAFIMAFASSRGWHRMACAIEDAGFVIHPSVFMLGYVFGSGFPKSTRIDASTSTRFCECENSRRQFPVRDFQHNGHGEKHTNEGSQLDCPVSDRLYDELPLSGQGDDQDVAPLQDGVQEHNHSGVPLIETLLGKRGNRGYR